MMLLNELFIKPVGEVIEQRSRKIAEGLEASKGSRDEIRALTDEYEKRLAKTREEAQAVISTAVTSAQSVRNKELGDMKDRARRRLDESRDTLQAEKTVLVDNLVSEEAQLVSQIVSKVLNEPGKAVEVNSASIKQALEGAV